MVTTYRKVAGSTLQPTLKRLLYILGVILNSKQPLILLEQMIL